MPHKKMRKKKIYYYGPGVHTYFEQVLKNPPEGYEFIIEGDPKKVEIIKKLRENNLAIFLYKNVIKKLVSPLKIIQKVYYKPSPDNIDLIFSAGMIHEKKPWVSEIIDNPFLFAGYDYGLFIKNLKNIEKILASSYCKKIIVNTTDCKKQFEKYFSPQVTNKIELLPPGILRQEFKKKTKKEVNFLFMGSTNNPRDFLIKGGLEALESFTILSKKYNNIRLFFRSQLPEGLKEKYDNKNIIFLESRLSNEQLKKVYTDSDILLLPGHTYFIMAFLESISFGLPIISLDTYGVSDFVINNRNGFAIKPSDKIPYNVPSYPVNIRSKEFIEPIKNPDKKVIEQICEKAELLIKDKKLRQKMSRESLNLARTKFSMENRKKRLKEIFDSI